MKNKVEIEGKVLNSYMSSTNALITTIAVSNLHNYGKSIIQISESKFNAIMVDDVQIRKTFISKGDTVSILGHLKVDINSSGHNVLKLYADQIEVIKPHTIRDSTRERLCM